MFKGTNVVQTVQVNIFIDEVSIVHTGAVWCSEGELLNPHLLEQYNLNHELINSNAFDCVSWLVEYLRRFRAILSVIFIPDCYIAFISLIIEPIREDGIVLVYVTCWSLTPCLVQVLDIQTE